MCCSGPSWKREEVPDHKFDFIDVTEFRETGCFTRLRYLWVYILVIKSFAVYASDVYTAIAMLASNYWSGQILQNAGDSKVVKVPFSIGKWIFTGCIIFSFLLLAWEGRKARKIIRSRDISYAYTNIMANNYYSLKSYDHFCFFCQINNSKKKKDEFAFFVFFTFKGWKRLLLADAPRQVINALTLYSFGKAFNFTTDVSKYTNGSLIRGAVLVTMAFTVIVWIGSAILLLIAAIFYVPLLCYIRGNLKEYCCHKIDKRIAELVKRMARRRLAKDAAIARKEAAGDFSHLRDRKGNVVARPTAQPTLPNVGAFDDDDFIYAKSDVGSNFGQYPPSNVGYAQRYQLTDGPAPQPPFYSAGSDIGSIRSTTKDRLVDYPRGAESSHSLVDVGPYPMTKAPSYRSQDSGGEKRWESEPAPPMPDHSDYFDQVEHAYGDAGDAAAYRQTYGDASELGANRQTYGGSEVFHGENARVSTYPSEGHYQTAPYAYEPRADSRASQAARPESAFDVANYYNDRAQFDGVQDSHDHWTPGQPWPPRR